MHKRIKGIESAHFRLVGNNLIKVLSLATGDSFTPETKQAWIEVYEVYNTIFLLMFVLRFCINIIFLNIL